jgi:hypothetical protein
VPALNLLDYVLIALAGAAAGLVNALAGGGTLISFPVLTALGLPAVVANVTNTVALSPGYLGATLAQARDLRGQGRRLWVMLPAAVIGGVLGAALLLNTGERLFARLVPWLILLAAGLLAVGDPLRAWLLRRGGPTGALAALERWAPVPVGLASVYGGYFGAGLSVIVLAVLGLTVDETLVRLNALKQLVAFSTNIAAALFFLFSGQVVWPAAVVLALGAVAGGALGGRLASRIPAGALRKLVVVVGVAVGLVYLFR